MASTNRGGRLVGGENDSDNVSHPRNEGFKALVCTR